MERIFDSIRLMKLDKYIIKKFLGTFFFSIILILSIAIIFDFAEKIDDFNKNNATWESIIFDYYFNFVPYYGNLFTPLFTFLSVIFFTSKMANDTEFVAMLSSGMSFNRIMRPYIISATLITLLSFSLSGFVIPRATKGLLEFENQYIKSFKESNARNVQLQIDKGLIMYIERFDIETNEGYRMSLESFKGKTLTSRLTARRIDWDSTYHWKLKDYVIREFDGMREHLERGTKIDTTINIQPKDFFIMAEDAPQLNLIQLKQYINKLKNRGAGNVTAFEVEYIQRFSTAISILIMTLIGLSLSFRKVRGGMGLNLGIGLALCGIYIIFLTLSTTFAVNKTMPLLLAVWLPNIIFLSIGLYLYLKALR